MNKHQNRIRSKTASLKSLRPGAKNPLQCLPLLLCASPLMLCQQAGAQATQPSASTTNSASTAAASVSTNAAASCLPEKPAWLTDVSLGLKETYDNNIFGVSGFGAGEKGSWITTISPSLGFNFAPLLGEQTPFQTLALGYTPEFNIYHDAPTESYNAQRLSQSIKASSDPFSFSLDNAFTYIDGSSTAPTYAGLDSNRSAYATAFPRERRQQIQDRSKVVLQYDQPHWFVRPTASLLYYDLMTDQRNIAGYQNYADRYDVNGGVDFGYKITPKLAVTLGYRYGHQYQEQFASNIDSTHTSSPSDYHRALIGLEGSPWTWLTFAYQGGPDFRSYETDSATHVTPVSDFNPITYYGEGSATATLTDKDRLSLRYKQWRWVSSTGKLPLTDSLYELSYKRKLVNPLTFDLTGRIQSSDYNCGDASTSKRDDYVYSVSTGLTWVVNPHFNMNLTYTLDLGRNQQDNVDAGDYREYDHQMISFGLQFKL